jgi:hypothetical protein
MAAKFEVMLSKNAKNVTTRSFRGSMVVILFEDCDSSLISGWKAWAVLIHQKVA